jgi:hypothetical protein
MEITPVGMLRSWESRASKPKALLMRRAENAPRPPVISVLPHELQCGDTL